MSSPEQPEQQVETIELDRFLKMAQVAQSGGEAKVIIRSGVVQVNGIVETRRGRKLRPGDMVEVNGEQYVIESDNEPGDT
jgi:ribosome-associated protein